MVDSLVRGNKKLVRWGNFEKVCLSKSVRHLELWERHFKRILICKTKVWDWFEIDRCWFNYQNYKFGFEYLTQLDTPVRGGLVYSTSPVNSLPSSTMFTFGSGKKIENIVIDISGTYQLYTYKYPDLFVVENDVRPDDYDTIRDSQLNLFLAVSYLF